MGERPAKPVRSASGYSRFGFAKPEVWHVEIPFENAPNPHAMPMRGAKSMWSLILFCVSYRIPRLSVKFGLIRQSSCTKKPRSN